MSENTEATQGVPPSQAVIATEASFFRRNWGKVTLTTIVVAPLLIFTIWAGLTLAFTYSSGDRVGYVQKVARKGWLCKTWEGELQLSNIPGSAPVIFAFTVRDDSVAEEVRKLEGQQVSLHYDQHIGVPTRCFGDTEYFITGVRALQPAR